jgi:hypothetical protein
MLPLGGVAIYGCGGISTESIGNQIVPIRNDAIRGAHTRRNSESIPN